MVTGGTGALGTAVVQMLVDAGAVCHIPAHARPDPARFPLARHERVRVTAGIDLTDENAVASFYSSLPSLWSSVHTAGGFSAAPINERQKYSPFNPPSATMLPQIKPSSGPAARTGNPG